MSTCPPAAAASNRPWALGTLPPFPAVALKILEELSKDDFELRQIVRLAESDPAFAAELLRVANSALYGFSYQIRSVQHAAVTLGTDFVKALAMTVAMRTYMKTALRLPVLRRCWRHSLACAVLTSEIAPFQGVPGDSAYTAGLLHDIGRIGLLAAYPAEYANLLTVTLENSFDLLHCERELFDVDHCEAGAWLAREWRLPEEMAEIAARHHEDLTDDRGLMTAVKLGCLLADALDFSVLPRRGKYDFDEIAARFPDVQPLRRDAEELKTTVTRRIDALN